MRSAGKGFRVIPIKIEYVPFPGGKLARKVARHLGTFWDIRQKLIVANAVEKRTARLNKKLEAYLATLPA